MPSIPIALKTLNVGISSFVIVYPRTGAIEEIELFPMDSCEKDSRDLVLTILMTVCDF